MAATYRLTFWRRVVNCVVCGLLRVGFGPPRTYLLTVRGRTTGQTHSTPVTLVDEAGQRWLVAPYGAVGWVRNARAAGEVTLSRGTHSDTFAVFEVSPDEAAPILKRYVTEVRITRPFFDVPPQADLVAFVAVAPRHPVFRIVPLTG